MRAVERRTEARMQRILNKLEIPLEVVWAPNKKSNKHGFIERSSRTLFILDEGEEDCWQTFVHECLEFKLEKTLKVYRTLVNLLIGFIEKLCYEQKEEFLEFLPRIFELVGEERKIEQGKAKGR